MATLTDLLSELNQADGNLSISIFTPSGLGIASHYHITEIGRTTKNFVDCGGTKRSDSHTSFQIWVANDTDHRVRVSKLVKIIESGLGLVDASDQVVFEYDNNHSIILYGIEKIQRLEYAFNIFLSKLRTNCLAPDKCNVAPEQMPKKCCGPKGCC